MWLIQNFILLHYDYVKIIKDIYNRLKNYKYSKSITYFVKFYKTIFEICMPDNLIKEYYMLYVYI